MSSYDRFLEHQKLIVGNKKKKEKKPEKKMMKIKKEKAVRHRQSENHRVRNVIVNVEVATSCRTSQMSAKFLQWFIQNCMYLLTID